MSIYAYTCKCGKRNDFGHEPETVECWKEKMGHTCDCGRVNTIKNGKVLATKAAPKRKKGTP